MSFKQVDQKLSQLTCGNEKEIALKHQLQFRQKFNLACQNMGKTEFQLPEKGKDESVLELANNLKKVMEQLQKDKDSIIKPSNVNVLLPSVIPQN